MRPSKIQVQEVINFCKRKGYYAAYSAAKLCIETSIWEIATAQKDLKDAKADPRTTKEKKDDLVFGLKMEKLLKLTAEKSLLKKESMSFLSTRRS